MDKEFWPQLNFRQWFCGFTISDAKNNKLTHFFACCLIIMESQRGNKIGEKRSKVDQFINGIIKALIIDSD